MMHPDWWTIGLQTVNFGILVWLLQRLLYKPVLAMIDARTTEVRRQFDAAREAGDKARAQAASVEAARAAIATEREAVMKAAVSQAQGLVEARRAQAERDAEALAAATRKALAAEREQALDEARRLALDLGADLAQRLLAEMPMQYRAEAWIERIERHLQECPPAERDALVRQLADGQALQVVTAGALPPATTEHWKQRLRTALGATQVSFTVDPRLIAGAELHFPTAILRFSWQGALSAARAEVDVHAKPR
jgi:F-type H+-transporting ATPase subunit b